MNLSHFKSLQTTFLRNRNWKRSEFTNKTADFSRSGKAKRFRTVIANVLISRLNHYESDSDIRIVHLPRSNPSRSSLPLLVGPLFARLAPGVGRNPSFGVEQEECWARRDQQDSDCG